MSTRTGRDDGADEAGTTGDDEQATGQDPIEDDEEEIEEEIDEAFERLVAEGEGRLTRPLRMLVPTGLLGGIDVGAGILAYLVVLHETGNRLLASLAFPVGFVALLLAKSELFSENFLVPVTAVVSRRGTWRQLLWLWGVTLVTNIVGGGLLIWVILTARPELGEVTRETGEHYAHLGVNDASFALAVLGGLVITLMTRMQHATDSPGLRVVPALLFGALLVGAELFHAVIDTIFMIGAMIVGGDVTVTDVIVGTVLSSVGNLVGGVGLVTFLRLVRSAPKVAKERRAAE